MDAVADIVQRSPEWYKARAGSLGASQLGDALARTKTGWGSSRANLVAQLVVERLTGQTTESYVSPAMQRGIDKEADARAAYELAMNVDVREVGMILHPSTPRTHASPDGLVGDDGMVEIKVPSSATHIETLLGSTIAQRYMLQMHWQLICANRQWVDFVSYDDRLPGDMQLHVQRVHRPSEADCAALESQVRDFLAEVDAKEAALVARFRKAAA